MQTANYHAYALLLLGLLFAPSVMGEDVSPERAAMLAGSCANCHGTEGRLEGAIPRIAGREQSVLETLLLAFKHDSGPDVTVMDRIAQGYSDAELSALAQYFASLEVDHED